MTKKIGWFRAYWDFLLVMLAKPSEYSYFSRMIMTLSTGFWVLPVTLVVLSPELFGDTPPIAQVFSAKGRIHYVHSRKANSHCVLVTDDGNTYNMSSLDDRKVYELCKNATPEMQLHVAIDWFVLSNGHGPIWPLKIVLDDGVVVVDKDHQLARLEKARNTETKALLVMLFIQVIFSLCAVQLVAKHKAKLKMEA